MMVTTLPKPMVSISANDKEGHQGENGFSTGPWQAVGSASPAPVAVAGRPTGPVLDTHALGPFSHRGACKHRQQQAAQGLGLGCRRRTLARPQLALLLAYGLLQLHALPLAARPLHIDTEVRV